MDRAERLIRIAKVITVINVVVLVGNSHTDNSHTDIRDEVRARLPDAADD